MMKIMTWNILSYDYIKPSYYPQITKTILSNERARIKRIITILVEENCDIMMLQEVTPTMRERLYRTFGTDFEISRIAMIWSNCGNVTMLRKNMFAHISVSYFDNGIHITCKNRDKDIVNIHLDHLSVIKRRATMKYVDDITKNSNVCIIGGDFNQQYRKDSRLYSLPRFVAHNLEHPTYYTERNMNIDNILTKGFARTEYTVPNIMSKSHDEIFDFYGSDHLPVIIQASV